MTKTINSNIIQYMNYAIDMKDLMISVENYERFKIKKKK